MPNRVLRVLLGVAALMVVPVGAAGTNISHAISLHGTPKYPADFKHFDYVNPDAPKGGTLRMHTIGTFDSFNPFIIKGVPVVGAELLFDTLTYQTGDEASTEYGLIAETIEVPDDYSWVAYTLRAEARFHDGSPVTVDDVIFSFELLTTKGGPHYRSYYQAVNSAEIIAPGKVRFNFSEGMNRELPSIVGQLPILSKAYWSGRDFEKTTLEPPLGNGPYQVDSMEPGRSITWRRVSDYWAADLPVCVGRFNFDVIRYDYYRDRTVALEAFKGGEYDVREEHTSKLWATGYDGPALRDGFIQREEIKHQRPTGMQGFFFNLRRAKLADPRVREALSYAFDFEWSNTNLFYDAYTRTESYFSNSPLAASGLPSSAELEILEPYRGRIPDEVFEKPYRAPHTDGSGNVRDNLRTAALLLKQAGWSLNDGVLVHQSSGEKLVLEFLLSSPSSERIVLPFKKHLERLGVKTSVRVVDAAQYYQRIDERDFDITTLVVPQSLSPGNEQTDFWSQAAADDPGSRNYAGIKNPVIDELIELLIAAPDYAALVTRTRALDRVLLWNFYVVPNWHIQSFRVAYWNKFGRPEVHQKYLLGIHTWWEDPEKTKALAERQVVEGDS